MNMSSFGCEGKTVRTIKPHQCAVCSRIIPKGGFAFHVHGMWQGDWQNWYCCPFCENEILPDKFDEPIGEQDFTDFVYEMDEATCPICKSNYGDIDYDIADDSDTIHFTCNDCGHEWTKEIYGITHHKPVVVKGE